MFEEASLRLALWWRSRSSGVTSHLARRSYPRSRWTPSVGLIRIGAVQMRPRSLESARQFADHAYEMTRLAVREGAELVVFPDHVTLPLLSIVPGLATTLAEHASLDEALAALGPGDEHTSSESGVDLTDVVALATPAIRRVYAATFSTLARRFGVHIAAGSAMLAERDGRVLAVCHLFGPQGRLLMEQAKTHLSPLERRWGLATSDRLTVASTPLGRLALAGSMEASYFEPFRLMALQGADIALVSAADIGPPTPWRPMRGLWARCQEAGVFGVQSALVGDAFGLEFAGPAAVYAPIELTPRGDGVLAVAEQGDADEVVLADLDIGALRRLRHDRGDRRNAEAIGRYLPDLYARPWPWPEVLATAEPHLHRPATPIPPPPDAPAPMDGEA